MVKSSEMVAMMRKDLIITKNLWDVTSVVQTTLEEWQGTLWNDINTGSMEEESKQMAKAIKTLDKRLRTFNAQEGTYYGGVTRMQLPPSPRG